MLTYAVEIAPYCFALFAYLQTFQSQLNPSHQLYPPLLPSGSPSLEAFWIVDCYSKLYRCTEKSFKTVTEAPGKPKKVVLALYMVPSQGR